MSHRALPAAEFLERLSRAGSFDPILFVRILRSSTALIHIVCPGCFLLTDPVSPATGLTGRTQSVRRRGACRGEAGI